MVKSALMCVPGVLSVTVVCADALPATLQMAISTKTNWRTNRIVREGEHTTTLGIERPPGLSRMDAWESDDCGGIGHTPPHTPELPAASAAVQTGRCRSGSVQRNRRA